MSITGPLLMLLLLLTFGPCLLNKLLQFIKQRPGTIQLMVQRGYAISASQTLTNTETQDWVLISYIEKAGMREMKNQSE